MTQPSARRDFVDVIQLAEAVFLVCDGSFREANMNVNEAGAN
jgi:hypothetical protein